MAKVTGPLFSISASGKIADAMVHFPWKGLNVVRGWVKPANKKTPDQGDIRQMLGGIGAASHVAQIGSACQVDLIDLAEGVETWVSALVKYVILNIFTDAAAYEAEHALYAAHTLKSEFDATAAGLGMKDVDIVYRGTTSAFEAGFQLYMLARACIAIHATYPTLFNRVPYLTALASWTLTQSGEFVLDLVAP